MTTETSPLAYRSDTLTALLQRALQHNSEHVAVCFSGTDYTLADIERESNRMARGLDAQGVEPGDRILTLLDNSIDSLVSWFAINKLGAVLVPLNTGLQGEFLRRPIEDSGATMIIVEAQYLDRISELAGQLVTLHTVLFRGDINASSKHSMKQHANFKVQPLDNVRAQNEEPFADRNKPEDLAMIVYTSGTTGVSKGCMLSHNFICNIGRMGGRAIGYRDDDVIWTALPLFHINAMGNFLSSLMVGATIVFADRFSVSGFWPAIEAAGATAVNVLGSMIPLIANAEDNPELHRCYGQLRTVAGAPFPAELQQKWRERFGVQRIVTPGFGTTEAALITSLEEGDLAPPGASGRRNSEFEIRIIDDEGNEVPPGSSGELICRPRFPHIMFEGYWQRPEDTAAVMRDGWYYSGDFGKVDEQGYFYFLGRKSDYMRRRGENVSAFEVENTLRQHPHIEDIAAYAVPSPLGEDDIMIAAVKKCHATLSEESFYRWIQSQVPRYALPSYIEFYSDLPRNELGKIVKRTLSERGVTAKTWIAPHPQNRSSVS